MGTVVCNDAKVKQIMKSKVLRGLAAVGAHTEGIIKRSFKRGSYLPYARGRKVHWSSAPGTPPAVDTGRLRSSITFQCSDGKGDAGSAGEDGVGRPSAQPLKPAVVIGTNVTYAPYLELGTSKMAARPFLRPALWNNKDKLFSVFQKYSK